jgi:hypothetical protein
MAAVAAPLTAAAAGLNPEAKAGAHAQVIQTAPWPDSSLPAGFSNARLSRSTHTYNDCVAKTCTTVGVPVVIAELDGPDANDAVVYLVGTASSDPAFFLNRVAPPKTMPLVGNVSGLKRSKVYAGTDVVKNTAGQYVTIEAAVAFVPSGSVLVEAYVDGDLGQTNLIASAETLLSAGVAHLH